MEDRPMANHPLADTNLDALEDQLATVKRQISDLWLHRPGPDHRFSDWEHHCLAPVFEALRDLSARSVYLLLIKPELQTGLLDNRIHDTIVGLVNDLLKWGKTPPNLSASTLSDDFKRFKEVQSTKSGPLPLLNRHIRQLAQEWVFQVDGHRLSLLQVRTLLQHMPAEDKEPLWQQLHPQLDRFGFDIVACIVQSLEAGGTGFELADPLAERYRLTPDCVYKIRLAAQKSATPARHASCPSYLPETGIGILDDSGTPIAEWAHYWIQQAYHRYLPGLEPRLQDLLARTHCTFGADKGVDRWPMNVSFDKPLQHWMFIPGTDPLEQLFDFAHHLGHGLHQDLAGGDGLYLGALPDSHNELLPLLNELLLRDAVLESPLLNAADIEKIKRYTEARWESGVWREWALDTLQLEVMNCAAEGRLTIREMECLWYDYCDLDSIDATTQLFRAWPLEVDRILNYPAVSSNALGGAMASMIHSAIVSQPEAGSLLLFDFLRGGASIVLQDTLEAIQRLSPN